MATKSKKEKIKIALLFGSSVILISAASAMYMSYLRTLPQDYTIGVIEKIYKPARGGTRASYDYYINGEKYNSSVDDYGYEKVAKPGKKFIIEYPEEHHFYGAMLLDYPVPDGVKAPEDGWDKMPRFD